VKIVGAAVCFALALLSLIAGRSTPLPPGGGPLMGSLTLPGLFVIAGVRLMAGKAWALQVAGVFCLVLALAGAAAEARVENVSGLVGETIGKFLIPFVIGVLGISLFRKGRRCRADGGPL
jgi:hypothetical protein